MIMPTTVEEVNWETWQFKETAVLTFIRGTDSHWLLINKKRGLGQGKVNAPGGRIDPGETALQAAIRECEEEVGLTPHTLRESAELNFIFVDGYSLKGFVFIAEGYSGKLTETDEADPFWCREEEIPYDKMWEDDQFWLPQMFNGERVCGRFIFNDDKMLSKEVVTLGNHLPC